MVYLDDIIYSNTSHMEHTVNLPKCEFARVTVRYAKVQTIDQYLPPATRKDLTRFLRLVLATTEVSVEIFDCCSAVDRPSEG